MSFFESRSEKYGVIMAFVLTISMIVFGFRFSAGRSERDAKRAEDVSVSLSKYTVQVYTDGGDFYVKAKDSDASYEDIKKAGLVKHVAGNFYAKLKRSSVEQYRAAADESGNYHFTDKGIKMVKVNTLVEEELSTFTTLCAFVLRSGKQHLPEGILAEESGIEEE